MPDSFALDEQQLDALADRIVGRLDITITLPPALKTEIVEQVMQQLNTVMTDAMPAKKMPTPSYD